MDRLQSHQFVVSLVKNCLHHNHSQRVQSIRLLKLFLLGTTASNATIITNNSNHCTQSPSSPIMQSSGSIEFQSLLVNFLADKDPLVRRACLKSLVEMYTMGKMVDVAHYSRFTLLLKDDNEEVREEAIHLIW